MIARFYAILESVTKEGCYLFRKYGHFIKCLEEVVKCLRHFLKMNTQHIISINIIAIREWLNSQIPSNLRRPFMVELFLLFSKTLV